MLEDLSASEGNQDAAKYKLSSCKAWLDALIGLFPAVGDIITAALSLKGGSFCINCFSRFDLRLIVQQHIQ